MPRSFFGVSRGYSERGKDGEESKFTNKANYNEYLYDFGIHFSTEKNVKFLTENDKKSGKRMIWMHLPIDKHC